ncbi:hypothetical protein OBBRIDRAFT_717300, partial [Obba rivulosa]
GFYLPNPASAAEKSDIFFLELIAILSAVHHAATLPKPPRRILVWTDSLDSVDVLNTLSATESKHNAALIAIATVVLSTGIDIRSRHIPGKLNIRADLLSRLMLEEYAAKFPADSVRLFDPP